MSINWPVVFSLGVCAMLAGVWQYAAERSRAKTRARLDAIERIMREDEARD